MQSAKHCPASSNRVDTSPYCAHLQTHLCILQGHVFSLVLTCPVCGISEILPPCVPCVPILEPCQRSRGFQTVPSTVYSIVLESRHTTLGFVTVQSYLCNFVPALASRFGKKASSVLHSKTLRNAVEVFNCAASSKFRLGL